MGVYMRFFPCLPLFTAAAAASFSLTQHIFKSQSVCVCARVRGRGRAEVGERGSASMIYLVAGKTKDLSNELAITTQHGAHMTIRLLQLHRTSIRSLLSYVLYIYI